MTHAENGSHFNFRSRPESSVLHAVLFLAVCFDSPLVRLRINMLKIVDFLSASALFDFLEWRQVRIMAHENNGQSLQI